MEYEPLHQLDEQIRDGELLIAYLRHLASEADKAERESIRGDIRETEADLGYMKRRRSALLTKWWGEIAGVPMPSYDESAATDKMADRFRETWERNRRDE